MAKLDHIMFAAPDLHQGIEEIYALTGVMPALGGSHPGIGTRNALLSLGEDQYLEIIAPDPDQDLAGTTGELIANRANSGIRGWAVASSSLTDIPGLAQRFGYGSRDITDFQRTTPDGVHLAWQLLFLTDDSLPFFIDWKASPHPAQSTPGGCSLHDFQVSGGEPQPYQGLMDALGIDLIVANTGPDGDKSFAAQLMTPKGLVALASW